MAKGLFKRIKDGLEQRGIYIGLVNRIEGRDLGISCGNRFGEYTYHGSVQHARRAYVSFGTDAISTFPGVRKLNIKNHEQNIKIVADPITAAQSGQQSVNMEIIDLGSLIGRLFGSDRLKGGNVSIEGYSSGFDSTNNSYTVRDLEGKIFVPDTYDSMSIDITTGTGNVSGTLAQGGSISTEAGTVFLTLYSPLEVSVQTKSGDIRVMEGTEIKEGIYKPNTGFTVGKLKIDNIYGDTIIRYQC